MRLDGRSALGMGDFRDTRQARACRDRRSEHQGLPGIRGRRFEVFVGLRRGLDNRFRGHVFADAQAAAIKGDQASGIGGFIGDEHLGLAVGAFHFRGSLIWFP